MRKPSRVWTAGLSQARSVSDANMCGTRRPKGFLSRSRVRIATQRHWDIVQLPSLVDSDLDEAGVARGIADEEWQDHPLSLAGDDGDVAQIALTDVVVAPEVRSEVACIDVAFGREG